MIQDFREKRKNQGQVFRSLYDYVMGALWLGIGIAILFYKQLGLNLNFDNSALTIIFGVSCLLYGSFRIYRGYQKK